MSEAKAKTFDLKEWMRHHVTDLAAYGGLILCVIIFSVLPPMFGENLWSAEKLSTLMSNVIVTALMSVGAVFVYAMGHMDISIGGQVRIYATLMVLLGNMTGSLLWGILLSLIIAIVIALINGATGELLHIFPVIPSLVFMMVLNGVSSIIYNNLGSRNIVLKSIDYSLFKNPLVMVVVLAVEVIIISYLFKFTKFGKNAKAIGANELAAKQSGINLLKYKMISYVIMGCCVTVASIFQMGYTGSASDSTGTGFEMDVMVALILGGMPLSGGMRSKVSCAIVGAFTFAILDVGLPLVGITANTTFIIKAILFIVIVLITCRKKGGVLPR